MTRSRAVLALAPLLLLAGCAPEGLSDRYRAEEGFWDAERYRDAFSGRGIPTARQEITKRYRRVLASFPFTPWDRAPASSCRASVNGIRGLARLALGHIALAAGDVAVAGEEFDALLAEARAGGPLVSEAHLGEAKVREARGDFAGAAGQYGIVFAELTPGRPLDRASVESLLEIPLYVAERFRALGEPAAADSVLADGERRVSAYRSVAADTVAADAATDCLARLLAARGDLAGAARILEGAAAQAPRPRRAALLLTSARLALDAGDTPSARRRLEALGGGVSADSLPPPGRRAFAELVILEGSEEEGRRILRDLFEGTAGSDEERARAGVVLGDLESAKGEWPAAVESYGRVEARYPMTPARVDASVRRARLLDAHGTGELRARARAAADLVALAAARPGSERSAKAQDGAALLLEECGDWPGLLALLDGIVASRPDRERAASALLRAMLLARDRLPEADPTRQSSGAARLEREFAGTLASLQARRMGLLASSANPPPNEEP